MSISFQPFKGNLRKVKYPIRYVLALIHDFAKQTLLKLISFDLRHKVLECPLFIEHEPLYLTNLIGPDDRPANFVCGKKNGVEFEFVER